MLGAVRRVILKETKIHLRNDGVVLRNWCECATDAGNNRAAQCTRSNRLLPDPDAQSIKRGAHKTLRNHNAREMW